MQAFSHFATPSGAAAQLPIGLPFSGAPFRRDGGLGALTGQQRQRWRSRRVRSARRVAAAGRVSFTATSSMRVGGALTGRAPGAPIQRGALKCESRDLCGALAPSRSAFLRSSGVRASVRTGCGTRPSADGLSDSLSEICPQRRSTWNVLPSPPRQAPPAPAVHRRSAAPWIRGGAGAQTMAIRTVRSASGGVDAQRRHKTLRRVPRRTRRAVDAVNGPLNRGAVPRGTCREQVTLPLDGA